MNNMTINFNERNYLATYNEQTGYYEVEIIAPAVGGIYNADITFTDLAGRTYEDTQKVQVFTKEKIKIETNKFLFGYLIIRTLK